MTAFVAPAWYGGAPLAYMPAQHMPVSADYSADYTQGHQNQFSAMASAHPPVSSHSSASITPPMVIPPPAPKLSAAAAASIGRAAHYLSVYAGYQQGHAAAPVSTAYTHPASHAYVQHQAARQVPSHAQHHQHLEHQLLLAAQMSKQDPYSLADMSGMANPQASAQAVPGAWGMQNFSQGGVPLIGSSSLYGGLQPGVVPAPYFDAVQPWSSGAGIQPQYIDLHARQHSTASCDDPRITAEPAPSNPPSPSRAACSAHSAVPFAGVACALLTRLSEALVSLQPGCEADVNSLNAYRDLSPLIAPFQNLAEYSADSRRSPPNFQEQGQIFLQFAAQVFSQTMVSPSAMFLALYYTLRLPELLHSSHAATKDEYLRIFTQPASSTPFKLLVLGLMIANKHLDDNTFLNRTWHEVTGIPLEELNQMERFYLGLVNFDISPSPSAWSSHISRLQHFFDHNHNQLGLLNDHAIELNSFSRIIRHFEVSQKTLQKLLGALNDSDPTSDSSFSQQNNNSHSPVLATSQNHQVTQPRTRPSFNQRKSSTYAPILPAYERVYPGNFPHFFAPLAAA